MAHFAEIGVDNTVIRVIVVNNAELLDGNGAEQESLGADFCRDLFGGTWVQTSYNGNFKKNFANRGYTYDSSRNAFIPPKPFQAGRWTKQRAAGKPRYLTQVMGKSIRGMKPAVHGM